MVMGGRYISQKERKEMKRKRCELAGCPLAGANDERCEQCTGAYARKNEKGKWVSLCARKRVYRRCSSCKNNGLGLPVCLYGCAGMPEDIATDGESLALLGEVVEADNFIDEVMDTGYKRDREEQEAARIEGADNSKRVTNLTPEVEDALRLFFCELARLSPNQLLYFHQRLRGKNISESGRAIGITKQAASMLGKKASEQCEIIRKFLTE